MYASGNDARPRKTEALYSLEGITGSGTKDDPAVVDTWLELKTALEDKSDAYIEVDVINFENTTDNGYSYLFENLHYPNGSFITVPEGYTKNVHFTSYTLKFVASPEGSNGPLESFILNKGDLTVTGLGKLRVGFNSADISSSIFKNEGTLTLSGGMEYSTDYAEVDGVRAMVVDNNGYLRINGGYFTGSNNATSGKGGYAYAIDTGYGSGIQTKIYGGEFKAVNDSGGISVGIYNPAPYRNNNTAKFYGGFFYGIFNSPDTSSSMNSLDNCLGDYCVYREGDSGETLFNGVGTTYVDPSKEIRVSNTRDWIDFNTVTPYIPENNIAETETLPLGTSKVYSFTYSGLPAWLSDAGYTVSTELCIRNRGNGQLIYDADGATSLNINSITKAGQYYVSMHNVLRDPDGEYFAGYELRFPVDLVAELIPAIDVDIERPLPGYKAGDIGATVLTPGVEIDNIEWCVVTGSGDYSFETMADTDRFEDGKSYKCWITFTPAVGSIFSDSVNAYFKGDYGEKGVVSATSGTYCWDFVSRDYIYFNDPVIPNVGDSANVPVFYELETNLNVYVPELVWCTEDGEEFTGVFERDTVYFLLVRIAQTGGGDYLATPENLDVMFAGQSVVAKAISDSDGKEIYFSVPTVFNDFYIDIDNFTYPLAGDLAGYTADYDFDSNMECRVSSIEFIDMNGNTADTLVTGEDYIVRFYVVSPQFPTTTDINVTINDRYADSWQIKLTRDIGVIEHIFTATDIPFLFTEDSTFCKDGYAEIDLEAMAEYSDEFMDAYINNSLYITWYDGTDSVMRGPSATYFYWDDENVGVSYYVEIKVNDTKYVYSDVFMVTNEEYSDVLKGDANMDGKVALTDAAAILKYTARWDVTIDEKAANVNGDTKITLADASLIMKYCAKWDVEFK